ncbi:hypothetical protein WJX72_004608 [[Myrmecia] bisecta]|uniref:Phosphatidic acid phosphatase type 2/haloperoxidase domain-containing protein n=1 Tax=[Myrmecia] bisecta TaxID=41462 RepID=A0AAW1PIY4_9CHLO
MWCLFGSVVASINCKVLKRVIKQQRPAYARRPDPGMPSSHANSLAFLATYVAGAATVGGALTLQSQVCALGVLTAALFLTWLRVALGYHTLAQVAVGYVVGAASAAGWLWLGMRSVFPSLAQHPQRLVWLQGATLLAVVFFACKNVAQWLRDHRAAKLA